MALVPCRECGKTVSTHATGCPHCGCPLGADATAMPPATAEPSPPVPPETATPTKKLWVTARLGQVFETAIPFRPELAEVAFDGRPVSPAEGEQNPGSRLFGPIPFVPESHMVKVTAVRVFTGPATIPVPDRPQPSPYHGGIAGY